MSNPAVTNELRGFRRVRNPAWLRRERLFVLSNGRPHERQGHDLLAGHLSGRTERLQGWEASSVQRLLAIYLRRMRPYRRLSPRHAYTLFRADSYLRAQRNGGLLHVLWGDELIQHVRHPKSCVFTLHQPYESWSAAIWHKIGQSAGIVCMAEREIEQIRRRAPLVPCAFIPHGVDVGFWRPSGEPLVRQVCAVGRYMRNFDMFLRVARAVLAEHRDITFRWVVNPDFKLSPALLRELPRERFHVARHLTPTELRQMYAESWLFCMPYENVTASNAIVEAMATGTPVFTTRVGGMSSYAGKDAMTMVENNDDKAMLESVSRCLASAEVRASISTRARRHAETHFSWPVVAAMHEEFYRQLLDA